MQGRGQQTIFGGQKYVFLANKKCSRHLKLCNCIMRKNIWGGSQFLTPLNMVSTWCADPKNFTYRENSPTEDDLW